MTFQGKTALITGGSRGIGKAIAIKLASLGANIAIVGKTAEPHPKLEGTIHTAADEIMAVGNGKVLAIQGDIRSEESIANIVESTAKEFGGIDILINNASAINLYPTEQIEAKRFDLMQSINVVVTGGSGDYEFQLDDGPFQDTPYFGNVYQGEYTLTVRDKNGCGQTELMVYALNYPRFFSPNGDGEHEVWNIDGLTGQPGAVIYIFDRHGKLVGSALPGLAGWDGTHEGYALPATDYWFLIHYTSSDGAVKEYKAHFSLLR